MLISLRIGIMTRCQAVHQFCFFSSTFASVIFTVHLQRATLWSAMKRFLFLNHLKYKAFDDFLTLFALSKKSEHSALFWLIALFFRVVDQIQKYLFHGGSGNTKA
jgi:hypothetical protein